MTRRIFSGGRRGRMLVAATAVLTLGGAAAIGWALSQQESAPMPPASAAGTLDPMTTTPPAPSLPQQPATPSTSPSTSPPPHPTSLPASHPVSLTIPAIKLTTKLETVGLHADGTIQTPVYGPHYDQPAWYKYSPTPGQLGPSVIIGHIDSKANGPSDFYRLGDTRPGDTVSVTRADGTTAVFEVNAVREYPKDDFPTLVVYGNTDHAALRLITCGGSFNSKIGHYRDNVVVFAHLVSSHPTAPHHTAPA